MSKNKFHTSKVLLAAVLTAMAAPAVYAASPAPAAPTTLQAKEITPTSDTANIAIHIHETISAGSESIADVTFKKNKNVTNYEGPVTFGDKDVKLGSLYYTMPPTDSKGQVYPAIEAKSMSFTPPAHPVSGYVNKALDIVGIMFHGPAPKASLNLNVKEDFNVDYGQNAGSAIMNNTGNSTITVGGNINLKNGYVTNDDLNSPSSSLSVIAGKNLNITTTKSVESLAEAKSGTLNIQAPTITADGPTQYGSFRSGTTEGKNGSVGTLNLTGQLAVNGKTDAPTQPAFITEKNSTMNVQFTGNSTVKGDIVSKGDDTKKDGALTIGPKLVDGKADPAASLALKSNLSATNSAIKLSLGNKGSLEGSSTIDKGSVALDLGTDSSWHITAPSAVTTLAGKGTITNTPNLGPNELLHVGTIAKDSHVNLNYTLDDPSKAAPISVDNGTFDNVLLTVTNPAALTKEYKAPIPILKGLATKSVDTNYGSKNVGFTKQNFSLVFKKDDANNKYDGFVVIAPAGDSTTVSTLSGLVSALNLQSLPMTSYLYRQTDGLQGATWFHLNHNRQEDPNAKVSDNVYTLGHDFVRTDKQRVGLAFNYNKGTATFADGSADLKENRVDLYATNKYKSGVYSDLILSLGHNYGTVSAAQETGLGDLSATSYGLSAEIGKEQVLSQGLTLTPQAQLQYQHTNAFSVKVGDTTASYDPYNSLRARLGLRLDKALANDGAFYAAANVYHQFGQSPALRFTAEGQDALLRHEDLGGTWARVLLGAEKHYGPTNLEANVGKDFGHVKGYSADFRVNYKF